MGWQALTVDLSMDSCLLFVHTSMIQLTEKKEKELGGGARGLPWFDGVFDMQLRAGLSAHPATSMMSAPIQRQDALPIIPATELHQR